MGSGQSKVQQQCMQQETARAQIASEERIQIARIQAETQRLAAESQHQHQIDHEAQQHEQYLERMKHVTANLDVLVNITQDYNTTKESLKVISEKISQFKTYKEAELNKFATHIGLERAEQEYKKNENEIIKALSKTNVHQENIQRFLTLTHGLLRATLTNQEQLNKLDAEVSTFGDLLERTTVSKLSIEEYFKNKQLERLTPILAVEDINYMDDLICDDDDDFTQIMDVLKCGIDQQIETWEQDEKANENNNDKNDNNNNDNNNSIKKVKPKKLTLGEKKRIKSMCCKPDKWKEEQKEIVKDTKQSLNEIAPLLDKFFINLYGKMKQTQQMLSYAPTMNDEQITAIENVKNIKNNQLRLKTSENNKENNNQNKNKNDENDVEGDNEDDLKSELLDDKETNNSNEFVITNHIDNNNDDTYNGNIDNLHLQMVLESDKVINDCMLLNEAAIISTYTLKNMIDEFSGSGVKLRALYLAKAIEGTCIEIVRSQGQIRQSVILSQAILKLKPANMTKESQNLWHAIDKSIMNILDNVFEMCKMSSQYFGFFLKFADSFQYYLSATGQSLMISLRFICKDIKDFSKFQSKLHNTIQKLNNSALESIHNCVKTTIGVETFEKARSLRELKTNNYLKQKKRFDTKEFELKTEYHELKHQQSDLDASVKSLEFKIKSIEHQIQVDNQIQIDNHIAQHPNSKLESLNEKNTPEGQVEEEETSVTSKTSLQYNA